jgi:hypothetical protein
LTLGVDASDACVYLGTLVMIDPARRDLFGSPSALMRQLHPFCRKWVWYSVKLFRSATSSTVTAPSACNAATFGSYDSKHSPNIEVRGSNAVAALTREAASAPESWKARIKNRIIVAEQ